MYINKLIIQLAGFASHIIVCKSFYSFFSSLYYSYFSVQTVQKWFPCFKETVLSLWESMSHMLLAGDVDSTQVPYDDGFVGFQSLVIIRHPVWSKTAPYCIFIGQYYFQNNSQHAEARVSGLSHRSWTIKQSCCQFFYYITSICHCLLGSAWSPVTVSNVIVNSVWVSRDGVWQLDRISCRCCSSPF